MDEWFIRRRGALEGAPGVASWLPEEGACVFYQLRASLCREYLCICNLLLLSEFGCSRLG